METPTAKQYHVYQDGNQSGPHEESTIQTMLFLGELKPADLCWTEGMHEWKPVGEVVEYNAPGPPPVIAKKKRNLFRLFFFGIIWQIVFVNALMFAVGFTLGCIVFAGLISDDRYELLLILLNIPAFFIAAALSIWATVAGKLPGTRH